MSTPIISPWFFYFIGITNNFKEIFLIIGLLIMLAIGIFCSAEFLTGDYFGDKPFLTNKGGKKALICSIIITLLGVLMPDTNTCYKMLVSSLITPQNIETIEESITDLIETITDSADELEKIKEDY